MSSGDAPTSVQRAARATGLPQSGTARAIDCLLHQDERQAMANASCSIMLHSLRTVVAWRLSVTPEPFSRVLHEVAEARRALVPADLQPALVIPSHAHTATTIGRAAPQFAASPVR